MMELFPKMRELCFMIREFYLKAWEFNIIAMELFPKVRELCFMMREPIFLI